MIGGTVKTWNDKRSFGFLRRDDGQGDVFVDLYELRHAGITEPLTRRPRRR